jgi:hypothetical protein
MKKIAFTIVLNGMPFIKKQSEILPFVFDEWHIIEGVSLPKNDTSWCKNIDKIFYSDKKLSIDGTSEFLDTLVDNKKIFVHRKYDFWNGKTEMCKQIEPFMENCILMQFDVDEIWKIDVLNDVLTYAENNDGFDGMLFKCNYFVGPNLIIKNEDCYGNYFSEWCRLWKIKNKTHWISHEPPRIKNCCNFLTKNFTKQKEWIFDHYAYVLEDQIKFKENFYGYKNAFLEWKKLQLNNNFPCYLKHYFSWVGDNAVVDIINNNEK